MRAKKRIVFGGISGMIRILAYYINSIYFYIKF